VQRLCELLLNPQRVYRSTRKLMSALEKLLMVTSTLKPSAAADVHSQGGTQLSAAASAGGGGESGASTSMLSQRNEDGETAPSEPMDFDS
jgi:hypothetical protein